MTSTKKEEIMNYIGKKCIVRCDRAGVFYATVKEYDSTTREATLKDCRRIWYWSGAASISQLAMEGVKDEGNCKFTVTVPEMCVMQVIEIIPCSEDAVANIESVPVWKI